MAPFLRRLLGEKKHKIHFGMENDRSSIPKRCDSCVSYPNGDKRRHSIHFGVSETDVLFGRGKGSYEWKGNKFCKELITSRIPEYVAATKNKDKIRITSEIVSVIKMEGGRFLGVDSSNGDLYEVSDNEARLKVSQVRSMRFTK